MKIKISMGFNWNFSWTFFWNVLFFVKVVSKPPEELSLLYNTQIRNFGRPTSSMEWWTGPRFGKPPGSQGWPTNLPSSSHHHHFHMSLVSLQWICFCPTFLPPPLFIWKIVPFSAFYFCHLTYFRIPVTTMTSHLSDASFDFITVWHCTTFV